MAEAVYLLCAVTSLTCALQLLRAWRAGRVPLLLWTAVCFAGLAVNNFLLVVDLVITTGTDLALARTLVALVAMVTLLYGLIWHGEEGR
jgi:hypothetical protein